MFEEVFGIDQRHLRGGGEIARASLKEGNRVLIGTSILKVVAVNPGAPAMRRPEMPTGIRGGQTRTMSGSIDEIPLPCLQLLGSSKKKRRARGPLRG